MNAPAAARPVRSSPRRGSVLAAAMALIFMLMVIVLALHVHQSMSRQAYMTAEAELRFREGLRFTEAQQSGALATVPSGLVINGSPTDVTPATTSHIDGLYAKKIFDRAAGLPDLRATDNAPAHRYLDVSPQTPDLALRVFGSRKYRVVMTQVPGYAAYAPKGSIKIADLRGWSNPTWDDERKSTEAFSGVPAMVAARKDAEATLVTYGTLHVIDGTAKAGGGQAVAFKAPQFPLREYSSGITQQLAEARNDLMTAAATGDKTDSLVGTSVGPEAIMNLFFGGGSGLENFLSLRNATQFWLPMIPGFSPSPPYLYEFYFSVPYPPDNASYDSDAATIVQGEIKTLSDKMPGAAKDFKDAKAALDQAQKVYDADPSDFNKNALESAQAAYNVRKAILDNLEAQVKSKSEQLMNLISASSGGMKGVPLTRSQDPSGNDGQDGWNYSVAGKLLSKLIGFLFSFDAKDIAQGIANDQVKLVHFGGKDRQFGFVLNESGMVLDATVTVPRGRTLKLRSNGTITIRGDLWLQRGSTFVADCNRLSLECPPGNSGSTSFFTPCGRIFLEEGASLICSGDVDVPGSAQWGSVVVGGVPGQIHPITTAIFGRNVHLTNGVFSGSAIDDLVAVAGQKAASLADLNNKLLRPLLTGIAPNAAKALGPFFARKPYFAKYASTFQVICPPLPPFGEPGPPIPAPIPLPRDNVLNPIARALGFVYSTTLNLALGENFYTHTDWWIFGEGVVPMVPQMDPVTAAAEIASFPSAALDSIDPATILTNLVESTIKDLVTYVVVKVIQKIVAKIALEVIPYGGVVGLLGSLLPDIAARLTEKEDKASKAGSDILGGLTEAATSAGKQTLSQLQGKFNLDQPDLYMREYNGVLVYGDTVSVGGHSASGMFVAEQDLSISSERCIGTLLCRSGNISCASLMFYPYFNRASLYVPKSSPDGWLGRATEFSYDAAFDSGQAVDVGPPAIPQRVSAEGWAK